MTACPLCRPLNFVISLIMCLALTSNANATGKCETLSANGNSTFYPFVYRMADDNLGGAIVDSTREALGRMGLKLELWPRSPWKRVIFDLQKGHIDIVLGGYLTKQRKEKFLWG